MSHVDQHLPEEFSWEESDDLSPRSSWLRLAVATVVFGLITGLLLGVGGMVMLAFG
ncbi:hypothetical protein [Enemella sp. A6]|uniref:hypothetical protein n=1 Tax=Enemella sp. A6 TaxID=3440152 RepID=UPI003EBF7DE8